MKQILIKQGKAFVENVPSPKLEDDSILVQTAYSCISIGTEISGLKMSGDPLWRRALKQPENVKKVLASVASIGFSRTKSVIKGQLDAGVATGYSASGVVIDVGSHVKNFKVGDRVACAGAQCAHHAEFIRVPENLAVELPSDISLAHASTVTLGAIAMQGVRRASPTLGECFVVIGLGILGQLTVQLLKANGNRVIGIDLDESRITLAKTLGMDLGIFPENGSSIDHVFRLTEAIGADGVIITAATSSDEVISLAFNLCRKKGRVVLVGDVGLNLKRHDFYKKEIDFFISCSYGPGRYDQNYEELGLDYPVGYVRWTENRNMSEYLRLISDKKIRLDSLIEKTFSLNDAPEAYDILRTAIQKPLIVLLEYKSDLDNVIFRKYDNKTSFKFSGDKIRIGIIGAGGFAKGMHLPNLSKLKDQYHIQAIVSRTGHNAVATAKQFGANYATTDFEEILKDNNIDAVLVATRHHLHGSMVQQALSSGKHVLVEKPLTLSRDELQNINNFYNDNIHGPILLTGFNRRFSPIMQTIYKIVKSRSNPMILNYRMNAGYIPLEHWVHGPEGGGRNCGEACHIYDLFTFLTESRVREVFSKAIVPKTKYYLRNDNFVATLCFEDGSVANLIYTALGAKDYPKEQMDIFVDGKVISMNDYKYMNVTGAKVKPIQHRSIEKGQNEELIVFYEAIKNTGVWPIPLWQQIQTTDISLKIEEQLLESKQYQIKMDFLCVE